MKFKKGQIPWNKNLKGQEYLKHYGGVHPSKGLTKDTSEIMRQVSERMIKNNPMKRADIREKVSRTRKENWIAGKYGLNSGNFKKGQKMAEITKMRISERLKGRKQSEEWKEKRLSLVRGRKYSDESKKKMSLVRKGKTYEEIFGVGKAKNIKKLLSKIRKGEKNPFYGKHHTEETIKKIIKSQQRKPNRFEIIVDNLLQKHFPNEWKYVGNGKFFIGLKNPDFININDKKICIEFYYDYYKIRDYGSVENYKRIREKIFLDYGWKTIFISYNELNNEIEFINKFRGGLE